MEIRRTSDPQERNKRTMQNAETGQTVVQTAAGQTVGAPTSVSPSAVPVGDNPDIGWTELDLDPELRKLPGSGGSFPFQPGP
jgi:hypothetical protein